MAQAYPNLEGFPEIPGVDISMKTAQIMAYINVAHGLIKRIDDRVNILASRLGLQSMVGESISNNSTIVKHQTKTCSQVYKTCEKTNVFTHTMPELADILKELPADRSEVINGLIVLRKFAATMKTNYDEMLSLMNKFQEKYP